MRRALFLASFWLIAATAAADTGAGAVTKNQARVTWDKF